MQNLKIQIQKNKIQKYKKEIQNPKIKIQENQKSKIQKLKIQKIEKDPAEPALHAPSRPESQSTTKFPYVRGGGPLQNGKLPYVTKTVSQAAQNIDRVLPFGKFGDVSTSSRYIAAENI